MPAVLQESEVALKACGEMDAYEVFLYLTCSRLHAFAVGAIAATAHGG